MTVSSSLDQLTPRQLEILALLSKGLTNADICELLGISRNTVKVHITALTQSLGVANRTEAAVLYERCLTQRDHSPAIDVVNRIGRPVLAVLQMLAASDANQDVNTQHLANGLTQDLITRLSTWRWFPVIAHSSSQQVDGDGVDVVRVGRELSASYLITGILRVEARRARLSVNLWETAQGINIWSDTIDFELDATLDTQDRIARQIVAHIAPELISYDSAVRSDDTQGFDVWQQTMLGMTHLTQRTPSAVDAAEQLFKQALATDDSLVLPWYGLVWVHHHRLVEQWSQDLQRTRQQLFDAVDHCRRLEPNGAPTQLVLGMREMLNGRAELALKHLERAAYLNPSSTQALGLLGQCYCLSNRPDECIAVVEEALLLNPYNPNTWAQKGVISLAHFAAGRYQQAEQVAASALEDKGDAITPHLVLVASAFEQSQPEQVLKFFNQLMDLRPQFELGRYLQLIAPVADPAQIQRIEDAFGQALLLSKQSP